MLNELKKPSISFAALIGAAHTSLRSVPAAYTELGILSTNLRG